MANSKQHYTETNRPSCKMVLCRLEVKYSVVQSLVMEVREL